MRRASSRSTGARTRTPACACGWAIRAAAGRATRWVVETRNFTDRTGIGANGGGAVHSEDLRLVERISRVGDGTIRYEFTVHDPATYTRPWTARFEIDVQPGYEIFEYACHEGNYAVPHMLSAARAEEAAEAAASSRGGAASAAILVFRSRLKPLLPG